MTMSTHFINYQTLSIANTFRYVYTYPQARECNYVDKSCFSNFGNRSVDKLSTYTFLPTFYTRQYSYHNLINYLIVISEVQQISTYTQLLLTLYFLYIKKDIINEVIS